MEKKRAKNRSKFNVKKGKIIYDNKEFRSKLEVNHYTYFMSNSKIEVLEFEPYFLLLEPFEYYDFEKDNTRKYGKFSYKADFRLRYEGVEKDIIWESKGMAKPEFNIRKKIWYNQYGATHNYVMSKSLKHCKAFFEELEVRVSER